MKNLFKVIVVIALIATCIFAFVACGVKQNGGDQNNNQTGNTPTGGGITDIGDYAEIENSYRVRLVYSYTARVENESGRIEYQKSIVTVSSFYIPKDNPVISGELVNEMKSTYFHGFQFVNWYESWDTSTQTPVGDPYVFPDKIDKDITLYCDRGDKAGPNITWSIENIDAAGDVVNLAEEEVSLRLRLSGSGDMYNFQEPNGIDVPWYDYIKNITEVVVEPGITSIGNNSFNGFGKLVKAELPEGLVRIGSFAFMETGISKLQTPDTLKVIDADAFNSTALKEVILNDGLETLGERAFYGSNKIKSIVFPASITNIPVAVFHPGGVNNKNNSHSLSKVYYRGTEQQFKSIYVNMDNTWFQDKPTIYYYKDEPQGGEQVVGNYWRFITDANENLVPVQYCYVIKYVLGSGKAFLCSTYVPVSPEVDGSGNYIYDEEGNVVLRGKITAEHLKFQNSITYHNYQFAGFTGGPGLVIGNEIDSDLTYVCQRGKILSPDGGIKWSEANGTLTVYIDTETKNRITEDIEKRIDANGKIVLFANEIEILAEYLGASVDVVEARADSNGYTTITEAEKQAIIDGRYERSLYIFDFEQSMDTTSLWSLNNSTIEIADGIKYIGKYTFAGISRTPYVIIPASVEGVHANAFDGCADLLYIYYNGIIADKCPSLNSLDRNVRAKAYSFVEHDGYAELGNNIGNFWTYMPVSETVNKFVAWELKSSGALTLGGEDEMFNFATPDQAPWYCVKDYIVSVDFIKNVKTIGENIVNGYANLKKIDIPANVRYIPESAFDSCGLLTDGSKYDKGVIVINGHLLKVNSAQKNPEFFEIANGVTTIAEGAFDGCTNIKRLYVPRSVKFIHPDAFPDSDIEIIFVDGDKAFWSALTSGVDFGEAEFYYRSNNKPNDTTGKYWYKSGSEYVIWGTPNSDESEEA